MSPGYFDHASATPLLPSAQDVWQAAVMRGYADPRRLHSAARSARLLLDNAREVVAGELGVRPDEVTFTRSGTDAVHRGLAGLLKGRARISNRLIRSAVEHSSVLHTADWMGAEQTVAEVDPQGRCTPGSVRIALGQSPVAAVAVQSANHEVGTVQPIAEIAALLGDTPLFVDACASLGHQPLPEGWSVAAGSAHKWGGPAGVGVLLVRKGTRWRQPFPGDDRIDERTAGFEDVPGALAAAAALQAAHRDRESRTQRLHELVDRIRDRVADLPDAEVVGDPADRLPHLVTFSFLYIDGEALVTELDRLGFAVASGSACTSATHAPSHVLAAMGALTHGNVRLSLGPDTTEAQVEEFLAVLPGVLAELRSRTGL